MAVAYNNLYPRLVTYQNLFRAFQKAARGKRGLPTVAEFAFEEDANLFRLQEELQAKTYQPGSYQSFYILDPKRRLVSAAPFRDRVVHHALCNVIEPVFERTFLGDSYANRRHKGTHKALDRAQGFAQTYPYVLQCDVRQYFPSIDHQILREILARKIQDDDTLWLCNQILKSGEGVLEEEYEMVYFPGDDLFSVNRPRGLPIGNLTSQFWANIYLNELDQFIKRRLHARAYLRYVDDFLLFSSDKRELWSWKRAIVDFLATLRLTLHERESTVYPTRTGIPFLGFRLYPDHRLLKRKNGIAFQKRFLKWRKQVSEGQLSFSKLHDRIQGWVAHAQNANTWGLRRSLFQSRIPVAGEKGKEEKK